MIPLKEIVTHISLQSSWMVRNI